MAKCIICGREFEPVKWNQKMCGKTCRAERHRQNCRAQRAKHKGDVDWYERQNQRAREYYWRRRRG